MLVEVEILESRPRLGNKGDTRILDAEVAESYEALGLVKLILKTGDQSDDQSQSGEKTE